MFHCFGASVFLWFGVSVLWEYCISFQCLVLQCSGALMFVFWCFVHWCLVLRLWCISVLYIGARCLVLWCISVGYGCLKLETCMPRCISH